MYPLRDDRSARCTISQLVSVTDNASPIVCWSIVLDTPRLHTAFKLLGRVVERLHDRPADVWLAPWGEERTRYETHFWTPLPAQSGDEPALVAGVLQRAGRLCSTWTVELPGADALVELDPIAFQGWTPRDIRKFTLDGVAEATFVVRHRTPVGGWEGEVGHEIPGVKQRVLPNGLVIRVVEPERN
jgi:hypothetical protein